MYTWKTFGPRVSFAASSMFVDEMLDSEKIVPLACAARAVAPSPSWLNKRWSAVGEQKYGQSILLPEQRRRHVDVRHVDERARAGTRRSSNAAVLRRRVHSSSAAPSM